MRGEKRVLEVGPDDEFAGQKVGGPVPSFECSSS